MRKSTFISLVLFALYSSGVDAQNSDVVLSQYIHNQYAINPAFGGSRGCFTVFGSFKKKWSGVDQAPSQQLFTLHSPLNNDAMALGLLVNNSSQAVISNTKVSASYTYRMAMAGTGNYFSLGVNGGVNLSKYNWTEVTAIDTDDPMFAENESATAPALGTGAAWYGRKYYASLSAPSLFFYNPEKGGAAEFALGKIDYLASFGYLVDLGSDVLFQPSALVDFNPDKDLLWDAGGTVIYNDFLWGMFAYRSVGEMIISFAVQPIQTLRIGYSFDYPTGKLATFGGGSHEISIQFDFGYKIKSANPKFF